MSQAGLEVFDTTLQKTHFWLNDLQELANLPDRHASYKALRAVLHTLRDRLPVDVVAHLGAQLPVLIRGFYYEGWRPAGKPERTRPDEFVAHVEGELGLPDSPDALRITRSVFELLDRHLSPGETEKVKGVLPGDFRPLWAPESGVVE